MTDSRTGGLATGIIAVGAAWLIHMMVPVLPFLTVAVLLGIITANLPRVSAAARGPLSPGLSIAAKHFMRAGIVLLGLKLSLVDVIALGWSTLVIVVGVVLLTFGGTWFLGKLMKLPGDQPLLLATGFSICGASAIGAMSGVVKNGNRDAVIPIALVTLCGTLAIGVLPLLMGPLGLNTLQFGHWVGASVHDVGQVVATAQVAGSAALAGALIIKLTRVMMLAPIVMSAAFVSRVRDRRKRNLNGASAHLEAPTRLNKPPALVPLFVAGFIVMMLLRTLNFLPETILEVAAIAQDLLLATALFGLGSLVRIKELIRTGGRAMITALLAWILVAGLAYLGVLIM